eukprot:CAMPEP_0113943154 /NCGR_PEP_ID=MMETSP1339-20121228/19215_1 /TAXON_ID=94617 /ORGANISM="Fibrocapsa japonica" /LENGTH=228 /DNA_ID=CAMNT_0000947945 /DNA_START=57 /DNA_END=740 /DNA_ORIENTATION=+ /assembly_acc=CAM_ASM_000762
MESLEGQKLLWERPDGAPVRGYMYGDESSTAGVIVVQEWWGINDELRTQTLKIAQDGFKCLIPDLYRGSTAEEAEHANYLMNGLDWKGAVEDIRSACRELIKGGCTKVGVAGFSMGGALALAAAVSIPEVYCAVVFYGLPDAHLADPANCSKPIQAHFGELDNMAGFSDSVAAEALKEKLTKSGCSFEVHMYPNAGHAFMNEGEEALKRMEAMGLPIENLDEPRSAAW